MGEDPGPGREQDEGLEAETMIEEEDIVEEAGVEKEEIEVVIELNVKGGRGLGEKMSIGGGKKERGKSENDGNERGREKERRKWLGN